MQVVVDGQIVNYRRAGKGQLLLMLHGWGSSSAVFAKLMQRLQSEYDCLAPDMPGFGDSQPPQEAWGLHDYAKWLEAFMQKLSLGQPLAVIAHSNGAAVAIKAISEGCLEPQKLLIYGGAGVRTLHRGRNHVLRVFAKSGKPFLMLLPSGTRKKVRRRWYDKIGSEMLRLPAMEETFKKTVAEDVQALAAGLNLPTLLIYGDQDQATPVEIGRIYHQAIDGSTLEIIGGAGHYVFVDAEAEVTKLTEEFLK